MTTLQSHWKYWRAYFRSISIKKSCLGCQGASVIPIRFQAAGAVSKAGKPGPITIIPSRPLQTC